MRLIDADALKAAMYHEAFENDASYDEKNPLVKWDSGLWVRYKMFERCLESAPTIDAVPVQDGILKARKGDYVTYRIDWLLDHLAQEISLLEGYRRGRKEDG